MFKKIEPSEAEKKKMFARAVRIMIEKVMSLHDYVFDGKIIRQKMGGSIGLDLTGVVADIYMCHWDELFKKKLYQSGIMVHMYKRYKDDMNLLLENRKENGKEPKEKENNTMKECIAVANSLHPSIQVTGDIPTNYADGRLPILDLRVCINEVHLGVYKIVTTHYIKDVSTRAVINSKSSHPIQMKKNVMINEIMRILRNCNRFCPWEETANHISYFMKRLQFSGYDQDFRYEVVKKAMRRNRQKIQNAGESQCQPSNQVQKKKSRFNADESTDAVMFVQATEDAQLRKDIQRCADRHKMKLKVVEKVESNVSKQLQRSNPFKEETCGKPDCQICKRSKGINCRTRGCVYEMKCCECDRKYRGQTGNSAQERINQHFQDWERKVEACPLYRHSVLYHGGRKFPVSVKILRACFGDPTAR